MRQLQEIFDVFVDNKAEEAVKSLRLFDAGKEGYDYKVNMYKLYNSLDVNEDPTILADEMGASLVKDTNYVSSFKVENDFLYLQLSEYAWQIMFDEVNDVAHTQDEKQTGDSSVIILPAVKSTEPISLTDVRATTIARSLERINEHMGYNTTIVGVYADHGMHIAKVIAMYNMSVGREPTGDMRWDKFSRILHNMFIENHEKELVNFIEASTDKSTLPTVGQFMYYEEAILGKDAVETLTTMDDSDRSHPITVQFKEFSKNVLEAHEQDRELFYIRPHSMVTYHEVLDFAYKLSHNMVKHGFAEMVGHADGKKEGDISVSGMENVALLHYGRPTKLLIDLAILSPFTERDSIIIITTSGTDQLTSLLRVKDMFVNTPNVKVVEVGLVHTRQKKNY